MGSDNSWVSSNGIADAGLMRLFRDWMKRNLLTRGALVGDVAYYPR